MLQSQQTPATPALLFPLAAAIPAQAVSCFHEHHQGRCRYKHNHNQVLIFPVIQNAHLHQYLVWLLLHLNCLVVISQAKSVSVSASFVPTLPPPLLLA